MALYAIGDLHLSLSVNKPMDIFGEVWQGHTEKLKESFSHLTDEDTTVLCGDSSWGISLEESLEDFRFIDALPGQKLLLKGNHDYWWETAAKMNAFLEKNDLIGEREVHLILVLPLAPPFVESDRIVLERNLCGDARAVARIVYGQLQAHETFVVIGISPPEFAFKRHQDLETVDLEDLFLDYHLMDSYRVYIQPDAHFERLWSLISIERQLVH